MRAPAPSLRSLALAASMLLASPAPMHADEPRAVADAMNALGLDLLPHITGAGTNAVFSPASILAALAMTHAGAAGVTRSEMARVLHVAGDDAEFRRGLAGLNGTLADAVRASEAQAAELRGHGGSGEPLVLEQANRLFAQQGHPFRKPFLEEVAGRFGARPAEVDFRKDRPAAALEINSWVEQATRGHIRDLVPAALLPETTRMVLVNAVYLKAPWATPFPDRATRPAAFHVGGGAPVQVPTMERRAHLRLHRGTGWVSVAVPYVGHALHLVVLVPDDRQGLPAVERALTPGDLAAAAAAEPADVRLWLPRFRLAPPVARLGDALAALGMPTAFDIPPGSADFDRMAPRRPDEYLALSEVLHRAFVGVDEKGTEAAAATAAVMFAPTSAVSRPVKPVEIRVDRPFLFAVQHQPTGACLFLGRVTDPR